MLAATEPGWDAKRLSTSWMTSWVMRSGLRRSGGGMGGGPSLPKEERFSESKFHSPPTGASPSMRMPCFLRSSRYQYSNRSCLRPLACSKNSRTVEKKYRSSRISSSMPVCKDSCLIFSRTRQSPGAVMSKRLGLDWPITFKSSPSSVWVLLGSSSLL